MNLIVLSAIITLGGGVRRMAHINFVHSFDDFLALPQNAKDMEFQTGCDDNHAWKLHIFLNQDNRTVSDPLIKDTVKFLIDNEVSFKMGNGGDGGKVFTIYIGEYDKARSIAEQLNQQFGDKYKEDCPEGGANLPEDIHVFNNIGMRFEGVKDDWLTKNKDSAFSYYGYSGIPSLNRNLQFNGMNDCQLSALACHIFLAEKCGAVYLGHNYKQNPWANKIFEDLPTKYTQQEIKSYVQLVLNYLKVTHQERFIHSKNLVPPEQGLSLSVNDIIPPPNEINVNVSGLEIMPKANKITIRQNKYGNDILEYKRDDKILASYSLNGDEHLVCLYSDDGSVREYLTSPKQRPKQFRGDTLYPIASLSLECRINNIASYSKALGELYSPKSKPNKTTQKPVYRAPSSHER